MESQHLPCRGIFLYSSRFVYSQIGKIHLIVFMTCTLTAVSEQGGRRLASSLESWVRRKHLVQTGRPPRAGSASLAGFSSWDAREVEGESQRLGLSSQQWAPCLRILRWGRSSGRRGSGRALEEAGPWVLAMLREPPGAFSWPCAPILRSPGASSLAARTHGPFRRLPLVSPRFFSGGSGTSVQPRVSVARDRS